MRTTLRLTHFKLHMDWGVSDSEIMGLLIALQTAPLEVLVLEGLAQAEFSIFERIVSLFPDLLALTLVRRQNSNQHQNKLAPWPHSSWKYASCFRGFQLKSCVIFAETSQRNTGMRLQRLCFLLRLVSPLLRLSQKVRAIAINLTMT
jgi:hypothetical protein